MKRPEQKDYCEFRGNKIIIDYGHATNFIDAQDEFIDQLEKEIIINEGSIEISELHKNNAIEGRKIFFELNKKLLNEREKDRQELMTLKDAVREYQKAYKGQMKARIAGLFFKWKDKRDEASAKLEELIK